MPLGNSSSGGTTDLKVKANGLGPCSAMRQAVFGFLNGWDMYCVEITHRHRPKMR